MPEPDDEAEEEGETMAHEPEDIPDDGLGGMKWECLCITLEEYQEYIKSIRRSKDPNEKVLCQRLEQKVLPQIEAAAEEKARKEARKLKELEIMSKLATAKRSSRISARVEKQRENEEAAEAERKRQAEVAMAKAEADKQRKMEEVGVVDTDSGS